MATLEMVQLRSKYPNTGRMSLRHTMPRIDGPMDEDLDLALQEVLSDTDGTTDQSTPEATTPPQVDRTEQVRVETPARKGGRAR